LQHTAAAVVVPESWRFLVAAAPAQLNPSMTESTAMVTASELAGFFAAHTVWCLSDADSFDPVLAFTTEDGKQHMQRLMGYEGQAAVEFGRRQLADNPMDANDGVLLLDGRIPASGGGKLDAIIIEMRCYDVPATPDLP
jgi:hypothetical protein